MKPKNMPPLKEWVKIGSNAMNKLIDRSSSNAEKYVLRSKLFGTDNVIPMWVADMDLSTPECVLDGVRERLKHPVVGYEMMPDEAYQAQIGWVERHHNYQIKKEWMSYSPSVVASIGCAIRAFTLEGDDVVVQSPVYSPFFEMVQNNNRSLILNPLRQDENGEYGFDLDDLESKITSKTKLLLLCSPHNPVGRVWKADELRALGNVCIRHGIVIVSDEIHSDIVFSPYRHIPLGSLSRELEENSVTLLGPGKTFNMAGFGISTVVIASESLRKRYEEERRKTHFGEGCVLSHVAFENAYRYADGWYEELMAHLSLNREKLLEWNKKFPIIEYKAPQGTYLAWLGCNGLGMRDKELREFFIQKARLGLSPGLGFGRHGSGFMRLNFAVTHEVLERALQQLSDALIKGGYGS